MGRIVSFITYVPLDCIDYTESETKPSYIVILGLILLGELVFSLPPLRLVASGYGESIMSIIMVGMIPAMAFVSCKVTKFIDF